jgi:DNA invertase Pin-like site-specific DNA recombinase
VSKVNTSQLDTKWKMQAALKYIKMLLQANNLIVPNLTKQLNPLKVGIRVNILNIGIMDNTPASKLIRSIFFVFAEFERDMIIERTQEGKTIAKGKKGYKEGRPKKYTETQIEYALSLFKEHSYKEVEKKTQISKSTLVRAKRAQKR